MGNIIYLFYNDRENHQCKYNITKGLYIHLSNTESRYNTTKELSIATKNKTDKYLKEKTSNKINQHLRRLHQI
jgi:hypothetical protein